MKYKTLYFSLLKTYLKSDIKLNIAVFLITLCSVFSFLLFSVGTKSSMNIFSNFYDRSIYCFEITEFTDSDIRSFTDSYPEITYIKNKPTTISYFTKDGIICELYGGIYRFPSYFEQLHHNINPAYSITSGRDFTEEELENDMGKIIVDSESGFSAGDKLTLPSDNGNVELDIIGTSNSFVLPFSFFFAGQRYCDLRNIIIRRLNRKNSLYRYISKYRSRL